MLIAVHVLVEAFTMSVVCYTHMNTAATKGSWAGSRDKNNISRCTHRTAGIFAVSFVLCWYDGRPLQSHRH